MWYYVFVSFSFGSAKLSFALRSFCTRYGRSVFSRPESGLILLLPNGGKLFLYLCIRICCGKPNANSPTAVLLGADHPMLPTLFQQRFMIRTAYHRANAL